MTAGPIERHRKAEIVAESNVGETWAATLADSVIAVPARNRGIRRVRMVDGTVWEIADESANRMMQIRAFGGKCWVGLARLPSASNSIRQRAREGETDETGEKIRVVTA
jgi:hypothetical protein